MLVWLASRLAALCQTTPGTEAADPNKDVQKAAQKQTALDKDELRGTKAAKAAAKSGARNLNEILLRPNSIYPIEAGAQSVVPPDQELCWFSASQILRLQREYEEFEPTRPSISTALTQAAGRTGATQSLPIRSQQTITPFFSATTMTALDGMRFPSSFASLQLCPSNQVN
jgi:hypothetical protein